MPQSKPQDSTKIEIVKPTRSISVILNYVLLALLILLALFLPPISLVERLSSVGYESIGADGGTLESDDGARISLLPGGASGETRLKFNAIPADSFLNGAANDELSAAANELPHHLTLKSRVYHIQHRGNVSQSFKLSIPLPDDLESCPMIWNLSTRRTCTFGPVSRGNGCPATAFRPKILFGPSWIFCPIKLN
ncbi:MAG: hypothetical protein B6243_02210 [Anaerolineaceae bacterium 4572_5.2]|nr:MAG: hypothetical protein B6243_02210 [Anaerolineaceae bacterium 4572_5.2]